MRRKLCCVFAALALSLTLAGCAAKEADPIQITELDVNALAACLAGADLFEEPLYPLDETVARNFYQLEDGVRCAAFCGTGATAEEAAVFETADEAAAQALVEQLQQRNQDRIESYRSYLPGEVTKLEHVLLEANGRYVILCVAMDYEAAEALLEQALDPETDAAGAIVGTTAE